MKSILRGIDFAAMGVAFFGIVAAVVLAICASWQGIASQISFEWANQKCIILAILFGLAWCCLRSKQLNER